LNGASGNDKHLAKISAIEIFSSAAVRRQATRIIENLFAELFQYSAVNLRRFARRFLSSSDYL